jgi:hypothetical protein
LCLMPKATPSSRQDLIRVCTEISRGSAQP